MVDQERGQVIGLDLRPACFDIVLHPRPTSRLKRSHQLTSKEQVRARPPLTKKAILRLKEQGDEGRDERARTGDGKPRRPCNAKKMIVEKLIITTEGKYKVISYKL